MIELDSALPDVSQDLVLDGSGVANLVIRGSAAGTTFLRSGAAELTLLDLLPENGRVAIGDAQQLIFDTPNDLEVATPLIDAAAPPVAGGELVKQGAATLTLRGANLYTGGTSIEAGTLRGDTTSLQGDIVNKAALIFDPVDSGGAGDYTGSISGKGRVEKTGPEEITFTGAHTYTGGTTVSEGTLRFSGALSSAGAIDIGPDGSLALDLAQPFTLNGELNGSGTLIKQSTVADASVRLAGGGAFTGTTRIEGGLLTDASGVIQGDVALDSSSNPAELAFEVASSRTYSGRISGDGQLLKTGAGTLTLLGSNTFASSATGVAIALEEGTLIGNAGSLPGDIETGLLDDVTLIFDQTSAGTFSADIRPAAAGALGVLALQKRGAGTLILSGDVTAEGGTTISQGRLDVNGTLTSRTVTVAGGGVLGGTPTSLVGDVDVYGVVSPGPASGNGTLTVAGNVNFAPGSVFEVNIDPFSAGDILYANDVTLDGARLRVLAAPGSYAGSAPLLILAANSLTGRFPEPETNYFAFLDETLDYPGGNSVELSLVPNGASFASFATSANQFTVGQLLDAEQAGTPSPDLADVFADLQVIAAGDVPALLDAIGGEPLSAFPTAWRASGLRFSRALHRRVDDALWGRETALLGAREAPLEAATGRPRGSDPLRAAGRSGGSRAAGAGPLQLFGPIEGDTGVGAWLDGWSVLGNLDGDGNSADVDYRILGTTLGVDYQLGERFVAGLAAGYAHADIDLARRASEGSGDAVQGALYAGYLDPRFHASASGRYAHAWNDSSRRIGFGVERSARADFSSQDVGARGELGVNALRLGPVSLEPLAAFDWAQLSRDAFSESGASSLDLIVESDTLTSLVSSLGGRAHGLVELGEGVRMRTELRAFWLREFGDRERAIGARLRGAVASSRFEIAGAELPRDWILAGIGWSISVGDRLRVYADYDAGFGQGLLQHEATLSARFQF
ncbi:MAG: autotransporter domain-containing protein [Myxococcales bacterium]|nr:autotransporter domain-containing protein [Myxococcales bacterium]